MERCDSCRYWERVEDDPGEGECHRRAPAFMLCQLPGESPEGFGRHGVWPLTWPDEWCGEWAPRPHQSPEV